MKKLLFVLAFAFIGQQAFSQMYMIQIQIVDQATASGCDSDWEYDLVKVDPTGNITYTCICKTIMSSISTNYCPSGISATAKLNQEFNCLISMGYKLVYGPTGNPFTSSGINSGQTWLFAIPWNASGLEEVATTLKSFIISPNPANAFVDVSLDYNINGECQVTFINEAGYIYQKQTLKGMSKNEKYNVDISKLPAGKYLVTIVNGKTYTTPQKLIVL